MIHLKTSAFRRRCSAFEFLAAAATLSLVLAGGCAGDKPKPAPNAAATPPPPQPAPVSLAQLKTELQEAKAQLEATTESLNKLQKSAPTDAQANYDAYTEEFLKLKGKSEGVSKRAEEIKARASSYFAAWDKQADVENPELKRQAIQQRANAERTYNEIVNEMALTRMAFRPYVSNLIDAGNYVRGRLTPATLASMSDLVAKANGQSKEVADHVDAIVKSIDSIAAATGEGAAVPAAAPTPAPAPAPQ